MAPATSGSSEARQIAGIPTTTALEPPLEVHSLPFRIHYDGACPVREYFAPVSTSSGGGGATAAAAATDTSKSPAETKNLLVASFRGRDLRGEKVALGGLHGGDIGAGMEGLVIRDDRVSGRFDGITVWNAGRGLSEADELPQVMHFLSTVAPALHGSV